MGNVAGKWAFSAYLVYYIYNSPSFNPASVSLTLIQCFHFPHIFAIPPWSSRFCILHLIYMMGCFFIFSLPCLQDSRYQKTDSRRFQFLHSQVNNFSIPPFGSSFILSSIIRKDQKSMKSSLYHESYCSMANVCLHGFFYPGNSRGGQYQVVVIQYVAKY